MAQIGRKPQDPALNQVTVSGSHKQILFNDAEPFVINNINV